MEPTEKDIVIKKIMELPPEQLSKVLVFLDALESVGSGKAMAWMEGDGKEPRTMNGEGREKIERFALGKTDTKRFT